MYTPSCLPPESIASAAAPTSAVGTVPSRLSLGVTPSAPFYSKSVNQKGHPATWQPLAAPSCDAAPSRLVVRSDDPMDGTCGGDAARAHARVLPPAALPPGLRRSSPACPDPACPGPCYWYWCSVCACVPYSSMAGEEARRRALMRVARRRRTTRDSEATTHDETTMSVRTEASKATTSSGTR